MTCPLAIGMTPAFYDAGHRLLRLQLQCLARQTCQDFEVWLIDPHFQKRQAVIPELAAHYGLRLVHVPYAPNRRIAKVLDCAIFNAVFCYAEAPRVVRYSCYRIARPTWVETMLSAPANANVDFYYHNLPPETSAHVWDQQSDTPNWQAVPAFPERDTGPVPVPANCYGNICWRRDQWLAVNGTDEVFTNVAHYEDMQFDIRAQSAGQTVVRRANQLYRLAHSYGRFAHRANEPPDVSFREPCSRCRALLQAQRWVEDGSAEGYTRLSDRQIKVCNACLLAGPLGPPQEYCAFIRNHGITQATVVPEFRIGRNLRILVEAMDGRSLADKVTRFEQSWHDECYYTSPHEPGK
jgi:hypothetical protein